MIQIERMPVIDSGELPAVTELLTTFNRLTFNGQGEMIALLDLDLPVLGKVVVSYYVRENHVQLQRDGQPIYNAPFFDFLTDSEIVNREQLVKWVKARLLNELAKTLTPADGL